MQTVWIYFKSNFLESTVCALSVLIKGSSHNAFLGSKTHKAGSRMGGGVKKKTFLKQTLDDPRTRDAGFKHVHHKGFGALVKLVK